MASRPNPNPWERYNPWWLVQLARKQLPDDWQLHEALAACTRAQANSCCSPKICGYQFVDRSSFNTDETSRRFAGNVILIRQDEPDVILDVLADGTVAAIEFF